MINFKFWQKEKSIEIKVEADESEIDFDLVIKNINESTNSIRRQELKNKVRESLYKKYGLDKKESYSSIASYHYLKEYIIVDKIIDEIIDQLGLMDKLNACTENTRSSFKE